MELTKRLQMNADLVPEGARVGDIGCDHGYVSIYLAEKKQCSRVIAMDINKGPLEIAKRNIAQAGKEKQIECRLSDGVEKLLPGEVDTVLIAGMGGMLTSQILMAHPPVIEQVHTLILQAQSDLSEVRKTVHKLGFFIEKEEVCIDAGKFYLAIRARRGIEPLLYDEREYEYGRILSENHNTLYREHLEKELEKVQEIRQALKEQDSSRAKERMQQLKKTEKWLAETITLC